MRKSRVKGQLALALGVWTAGVLLLQPPASAQSKCQDMKGRFVDVYRGGATSSGTVTNAGILDGTTVTVFNTAAFPTPEPTIVSYAADLTITTDKGQLNTRNVYMYDFATGRFTVLARIDSATSTGRFAGATGVLFINGYTLGTAIPFTYPSEITGEICLARNAE